MSSRRTGKAGCRTGRRATVESAARFGIDVLGSCVDDNHHHTVLFDRRGRIVCQATSTPYRARGLVNPAPGSRPSWLGARGPWNAGSTEWIDGVNESTPCLLGLLFEGRGLGPPGPREARRPTRLIDKLVYALTNPVKDGLVERVHHWPGVNTLSALLNRRVLTAHRPRHFFRANSAMPEVVTLELGLPPELGDPDEIRRIVRERVAAVEAAAAEESRRTGRPVLGRRAILKQWSPGRQAIATPCRALAAAWSESG